MDPRNDISFHAYFDNERQLLTDAMESFSYLGRSFEGQLHFTGNWVYARTDEEAQTNTGFNPVTEPDAYLTYLQSEHTNKTEEFGDIGAFGESYSLKLPHASSSPPNDPYNYRDFLIFDGGEARRQSDQLVYSNDIRRDPAFLDLAAWTRLTELIVAWRVPRYIWFDSYLYELEGRIHKHRAWGGWLGWFPHQINVKDLPLGALAIPVGHGTLVASQQTQLRSEVPQELEQAQKVELALVELGVLPSQEDLIRASPPLATPDRD